MKYMMKISLIDEVHEENQEQIKLELSKTFENIEETKMGIKWPENFLAIMKYLIQKSKF